MAAVSTPVDWAAVSSGAVFRVAVSVDIVVVVVSVSVVVSLLLLQAVSVPPIARTRKSFFIVFVVFSELMAAKVAGECKSANFSQTYVPHLFFTEEDADGDTRKPEVFS